MLRYQSPHFGFEWVFEYSGLGFAVSYYVYLLLHKVSFVWVVDSTWTLLYIQRLFKFAHSSSLSVTKIKPLGCHLRSTVSLLWVSCVAGSRIIPMSCDKISAFNYSAPIWGLQPAIDERQPPAASSLQPLEEPSSAQIASRLPLKTNWSAQTHTDEKEVLEKIFGAGAHFMAEGKACPFDIWWWLISMASHIGGWVPPIT